MHCDYDARKVIRLVDAEDLFTIVSDYQVIFQMEIAERELFFRHLTPEGTGRWFFCVVHLTIKEAFAIHEITRTATVFCTDISVCWNTCE